LYHHPIEPGSTHPPRWREPRTALRLLLFGGLLVLLGACHVPQPRGEGRLEKLVEPTSKRSYYLYLPKDYVNATPAERQERRWPIVMTFHGMKPFDVAHSQAREWEREADRYGYVVIAPILHAFGVFSEFPLRSLNNAFKSDEVAALAILDHVARTSDADPGNVLSTSWSSGGYLAHYMLNRHPSRFTCLAVRQSNFTDSVLDQGRVDESRYRPVLVLTTENDFAICRRESTEAIDWYTRHGYKNFAWVHINRLGHERTPDIAADFFARVCGIAPSLPPDDLITRQAIDGNEAGLAFLSGNPYPLDTQPPESARVSDPPEVRSLDRTPTRRTAVAEAAPSAAGPQRDEAPASAVGSTPPRGQRRIPAARQRPLIGIQLSTQIGFEPLLLVYSAEYPHDWQRRAEFRWLLNGQPIGAEVNGQRTLNQPGDYRLELVVVGPDGAEHRVARQIRVLRNVETSFAN
jgi:poly(3-hydroxybutyrate) depolymerase